MPQYDADTIINNTLNNADTSFSISEVWIIVSVLLAVIGGIFLYNMYFNKSNNGKFKGIKKVLYDYVNFNFTIIEPIFKVLYLIIAIALTLSSLTLITSNFFEFIAVVVFGNIIIRLAFELLLLTLKRITLSPSKRESTILCAWGLSSSQQRNMVIIPLSPDIA